MLKNKFFLLKLKYYNVDIIYRRINKLSSNFNLKNISDIF